MERSVKGIAILGSTGSVGTQTLDVIRSFPDKFRVLGLAARRCSELLEAQVKEFRPKIVCCEGTDEQKSRIVSDDCVDGRMHELVRDPDVDLVVTATVGDVALVPTISALKAGKDVALANKESVVMAGELLNELSRSHDAELLPLDSEPSAIWQCLRGEQSDISRLIITASGGAFRDLEPDQLTKVTPEQALDHPTWKMGPKITVDSATLINKAFEVIEAHHLFGVPWEDIDVVIHPESIIHSMVEFVDGSVKAYMSPPDMRFPIQYALCYPERIFNEGVPRFDPISENALTFKSLMLGRYPCFQLALDVAMKGGTWPAALCGADEAAVELFLRRDIGFLDIGPVIEEALARHLPVMDPSVEELLLASASTRKHAMDLIRGGGR